jgi:hypothetical protein
VDGSETDTSTGGDITLLGNGTYPTSDIESATTCGVVTQRGRRASRRTQVSVAESPVPRALAHERVTAEAEASGALALTLLARVCTSSELQSTRRSPLEQAFV